MPGRACQQTPTWPWLRNRRRRLVRVTERGGRRAEDFTALLPPRGDSGARALGEGGEGGEGTRAVSESEAALSQRGTAGAAARGRGRRRPRQAALALPSSGRSSRRPGGFGAPGTAGAAGDTGPEPGASRTGGLAPPSRAARADGAVPVGLRRTCNE